MTQTARTTYCMHCACNCDLDDPEIFREATVWISGEKSNRSACRIYTGNVACAACMKAIKDGQPPGEATLFDETPAGPNLAQWNPGFEAGWRGDQLACDPDSYHIDWISGYEAGKAARANVG